MGFHIAARALPETKGPYGISGSSINSHYFERIPLEIRLEIAAYLPTVDFLNLRLCSRAMADIFEEQTFWKTRFFIHGDRGYLAFLTEGIQCAEDWRLIYRCTHKFLKPNTELRARRQHWRQNRWLRNACIMTRGQNLLLSRVDIEWQKAASGMNCGRNTMRSINHKCQRCYGKHSPLTQSVPFSRAVVGLAISLLPDLRSDADLGETFIAGLELIYPSDTPNTVLGYRLPGNQIMIDLQERPLRGFQLIIEKGGVRAILPLFSANDWIGKPFVGFNGSCSLVRISTDNEILALSADFDASRASRLFRFLSHSNSDAYSIANSLV